jgi:predicted transcriptional regulator
MTDYNDEVRKRLEYICEHAKLPRPSDIRAALAELEEQAKRIAALEAALENADAVRERADYASRHIDGYDTILEELDNAIDFYDEARNAVQR